MTIGRDGKPIGPNAPNAPMISSPIVPNVDVLPTTFPKGGLRGPLLVFRFPNPASVPPEIQLPEGSAVVISEQGSDGVGYTISWSQSPDVLPIRQGDVFPVGYDQTPAPRIRIDGSAATGGLILSVWDYPSGLLRASSIGGSVGNFVTLDTQQTITALKKWLGIINEGVTDYIQEAFTPDGSQDGIQRGPFQTSFGGALFNTTWDNIKEEGYNFGAGAAKILSGEAAFGDFLEIDYEKSPGVHVIERYWQFRSNNDLINERPLFAQIQRDNGTATVQLTGCDPNGDVSLNIQDTLGSVIQCEKVTKGSTFYANGQLLIFDNPGGGARKMVKFLNVAGTNYWDLVQLLGTGLAFGNAGAIRVAENATDCGFFGTNPQPKPTITGSRAGNAALADLLTKGAALGLWTDSTTP